MSDDLSILNLSVLLCDACRKGQRSRVDELLEEGADPNSKEAKDENDVTPLHYACLYGWEDIVKLLLEKYKCYKSAVTTANITSNLPKGSTPLHFCCLYGHVEIAKLLIEKFKCYPNVRDSSWMSPLHYACRYGKYELVKLLIKSMSLFDLNAEDKVGNTPLYYACSCNNTDIAKELIMQGACPDKLLHKACREKKLETVKFLLTLEVNANAKSKSGHTPLQVTSPKESEIVLELITHGANPNVTLSDGSTPLHIACKQEQLKTARYLLTALDCDRNAKDKNGHTALAVTAPHNIEIIQELIKHGANPNVSLSDGVTPLHMACTNKNFGLLKCVLNASSCDPNIKNQAGLTPLQVTSPRESDIIQELIKHGANPNVSLGDGETPLHRACAMKCLVSVKCILNASRCDPNIKNQAGLTPLQVTSPKETEIILELITHGANPNVTLSDGSTPLHIACKKEQLKTAKCLLNYALDCDPNATDKNGHTTLAVTAPHNIEIILELIKHGANPNVILSDGETPLHEACIKKYFGSVKCILNAHSCDPNIKNRAGLTPLQVISPRESDIIQELINHGANPNVSLSNGETLLHEACAMKCLESVKCILNARSCDPDIKNRAGLTPLQVTSPRESEIIQELVIHGANPNVSLSDGETPLHKACTKNCLLSVKRILNASSCDPNIKNRAGLAPLQVTSSRESEIIQELIKHGAVTDVKDFDSNTPLHRACQNGHLKTIKLILCTSCDPHAKNKFGLSPLHVTNPRRSDIIRELLVSVKNGAEIEKVIDKDGNTLLHKACQKGYIKTVELLLNSNCNPNVKNLAGLTPLQVTTPNESDIVKKLISNGAVTNVTDNEGNTLLHRACQNGCLGTVKLLLNYCDPNAKNKSKLTPLHVTSSWRPDIIHELISHGAFTNVTDSEGNTPLHRACQNGCLNTVKKLLNSSQCNPNATNKYELTPLQVTSIDQWETDIIKELVTHGAITNVTDSDGNTPLHNACERGMKEIIKYLLNADDCKPNAINKSGLTPLQVTRPNAVEIIAKLITHGANPNVIDRDGNTPLHIACKQEKLETAKILLNAPDCNPNAENKSRLTPLQVTSPLRSDITHYLISRGAVIDVTNSEGNTPLHLACQSGCLKTVKVLLNSSLHDPKLIINAKNKHCLTPLQVTSFQKFEIVLELIANGANPSVTFLSDGSTPLHIACKQGKLATVKYILNTVDCNPNAKDEAGFTPLQVTSDAAVIRELIRHGANASDVYKTYGKTLKRPLQPPVKVFIVGNPAVGKSTLTVALQKESSYLQRVFTTSQKVTGVDKKTAGVVPHDFESKEYGYAIIYDFAGQREFYGSHAALLQNTIQSSPPIIIVVVDLCETEEHIIQTILYWLTFLDNQCTSLSSKPHVIIVGSHADVLKEKGDNPDMKIKCLQLNTVTTSNFIFAGFVPMDCQYPDSRGMNELRRCLKSSCNALRTKETISFNAHCFYVYLLDKFKESSAVTLEQVRAQIKSDIDSESIIGQRDVINFLPYSLHHLCKICEELNDRGHTLFLKDSQAIEESWVVIDKKYLLAKVSGSIFAPEHFQQHTVITQCTCSTGVVPLSSIAKSFPDPKLLINFLSSLEFCHEISDPEILHCITADHQACRVSEQINNPRDKYFLFPSLVSLNVPTNVWDQKPEFAHHCGWTLHCSPERPKQFLTSRFLQVLLLRIAFSFPLSEGDTNQSHPAIRRNCSIWKNGIFWANEHGVETLVEVTSDMRAVFVLMRCETTDLINLIKLRSQIICKVLAAKSDFCSRIDTIESFIDPSKTTQYPIEPILSQLMLFSMLNTAKAVLINDFQAPARVICPTGTIHLKKLLLYEPYAGLGIDNLLKIFEGQDNRIADRFLSKIAEKITEHNDANIFIQIFNPNYKTSTNNSVTKNDVLSVLKMWTKECAGTYNSLRKKLDTFSIFAGTDILLHTCLTERSRQTSTSVSLSHSPSSEQKEEIISNSGPVKSDTPTLAQLMHLEVGRKRVKVIQGVAAQWEYLALALGFEAPVIDNLRRDFRNDCEGAGTKLFTIWLNQHSEESNFDKPVTWETLIQCLNETGRAVLAEDLAELLGDQ